MKDTIEHLGVLALGYLWNHPLQQLNDLLEMKHPEMLEAEAISGLEKLSASEKQALKRAMARIFATDMSEFCKAFDHTQEEEGLELRQPAGHLSEHLPPWDDRLSYFDREGDPKPRFVVPG